MGNVRLPNGTGYAAVLFETEGEPVQIALVPESDEAGPLSIRCTREEWVPPAAGPSEWVPSHGRVVVLTFPVPPAPNEGYEEWEWDFTGAERPTPLKLKVKIRRPAR